MAKFTIAINKSAGLARSLQCRERTRDMTEMEHRENDGVT